MFNPRGSYQQPQWPQTFTQPPQRTAPPPAKKPRNNPIITRYPPPPGYQGPIPPQLRAFHQTPAWSNAGQPHNYGQQPYTGHPLQTYGQPQPYQHSQHRGYQAHPHAQPQHPHSAHAFAGYHSQHGYMAQQSASPESAYAASFPAWNPADQEPQRRHFSAPSLTYRPDSGQFVESEHLVSMQAAAGEVLEEDFYDECYFATHPDEIDERFSLGWIDWKAALPTNRPLPATFAEAELEALAPRKPLPSDDESISEYFIKAKRHEVFLSVRQTEYWQEVQDDVVFKEFPVVCSSLLSVPELLAKYKDRPDTTWSARVYSPTPDPDSRSDVYEGSMDDASSAIAVEDTDEQSDLLGHLERGLRQNAAGHKRRHSRASSTTSISSHKAKRPRQLLPIKDQAQEDILAALGVTGSPKMVYETPGPALGAAQQQPRNEPVSRASRHNSVTSYNREAAFSRPHSQAGQMHRNHSGYADHRRSSDTSSHHTALGSDLADTDASARAKYYGGENRKRTHDDSGDDSAGYAQQRDDDETPKPRRKQQRVDDPHKYGPSYEV